MATDEMIALKRAYADIILNTAKEAAARIMESERKAQNFQRELQLSKDEALRMLVRLKQMMDSKIADAESMSMSQQNKIDELEAQLQEAEDIVKDLREELRGVQSELEHLRNKKQYSNEQNGLHCTSSIAFPSNGFEYVTGNDLINTEFRRNELSKFYIPAPPVSNLYNGYPDLPSIILRSKEPGRFRYGCTQRIHASEGNPSNKELPGSRKDKDASSVLEDKCNGEILSEPCDKVEKETDSQFGVSNPILSFCTSKKRANRYGKNFLSSPNQISCSDQAAEVSNTTSHPISASRSSSDTTEWGLETTGSGKDSTNAGPAGVHNLVNEDTELVPISVDASEAADGEANLEKLDILSPLPEINESVVGWVVHSRPVRERVIKYTFQRKRKREPLSLDKLASKRPVKDQLLDVPVEDKLNLIPESSPENQKMAQVASQLLLLSETVV